MIDKGKLIQEDDCEKQDGLASINSCIVILTVNPWTPSLSFEGDGQQEAYVDMLRTEYFPVNKWTHLVVTFEEATKQVSFYRNGIAQEIAYRNPMTNSIVADVVYHKYIGCNSPGYN